MSGDRRGLAGHTVLVVGAGGGMGSVLCDRLASQGAEVIALDRHRGATDGGTRIHACDASDIASVYKALQPLADASRISALVNMAGVFEVVDFAESDPEHWQRMVDANLLTAMTTARAVLPVWLGRGSGVIINMSSTAGEYGSIRPAAAYAASKGGIIAFSKSLAREVSPAGVRVNVVSPGPVETSMLGAESEEAHRAAVSRTLLGRLGTPDDVVDGVLYLLTATWITGEVLRINGGSLI